VEKAVFVVERRYLTRLMFVIDQEAFYVCRGVDMSMRNKRAVFRRSTVSGLTFFDMRGKGKETYRARCSSCSYELIKAPRFCESTVSLSSMSIFSMLGFRNGDVKRGHRLSQPRVRKPSKLPDSLTEDIQTPSLNVSLMMK
jgi:predicted Zn-ribbon and HTH transcriptional regulator